MEFFNKLKNRCDEGGMLLSSGEIVLGFGLHEVKVVVQDQPVNVALSIIDPCDGIPVCHGEINKIGVTILENGFVIYADIKTNTACVEWFAESKC